MLLNIVRLVFFATTIDFLLAARKKPLRLLPGKLECTGDLMANISCAMEPLTTGGANLTIAGVFLEDANDIWVKLQSYDKVGSKYKQGFVGSTLDLCDFNKAMDKSFAKHFMKFVIRDVGKYIHQCPYQDAVFLEKVRFEGTMFLKILKSGNYRLDFRAFDAYNRTYYYLKFYIAISNRY